MRLILLKKSLIRVRIFVIRLVQKLQNEIFFFVTCGFRVAQFKINPKKALKITKAHEKWHSARIIVESE